MKKCTRDIKTFEELDFFVKSSRRGRQAFKCIPQPNGVSALIKKSGRQNTLMWDKINKLMNRGLVLTSDSQV